MKTELCSFSGYKIHPGQGTRYIRLDAKLFYFRSSKDAALFHGKKKPAKIKWTVAYRKANKKGSLAEGKLKKRKRVVQKVERTYAGANVELLQKVKKESVEERSARNAENLKQLKERREKAKAANKAKAPKGNAGGKKAAFQARGTGAKGR